MFYYGILLEPWHKSWKLRLTLWTGSSSTTSHYGFLHSLVLEKVNFLCRRTCSSVGLSLGKSIPHRADFAGALLSPTLFYLSCSWDAEYGCYLVTMWPWPCGIQRERQRYSQELPTSGFLVCWEKWIPICLRKILKTM